MRKSRCAFEVGVTGKNLDLARQAIFLKPYSTGYAKNLLYFCFVAWTRHIASGPFFVVLNSEMWTHSQSRLRENSTVIRWLFHTTRTSFLDISSFSGSTEVFLPSSADRYIFATQFLHCSEGTILGCGSSLRRQNVFTMARMPQSNEFSCCGTSVHKENFHSSNSTAVFAAVKQAEISLNTWQKSIEYIVETPIKDSIAKQCFNFKFATTESQCAPGLTRNRKASWSMD